MSEENTIEIIEKEETGSEKTELNLEGLESAELELVKKHGLLPEEGKEEVEEVDEEPDSDDINTDPDNFEDMDKVIEKDEKKFHEKYTPNQKALYFKQKSYKKKMQDAKKEAEELKAKIDELKDASTSADKLKKISELLNSENLTVEQIQSVINEKVEIKESEPIKPEVQASKVNEKLAFTNQIGKAKYDNFLEISKLAEELALEDTTYRDLIVNAVNDDNVDESMLADKIVKIAKFHPKYEELSGKKPEKKVDEKVKRVIKNSQKKISSASISSSGGKKVVNFDDLTLEQLVNLPHDKFVKVPKEVREKLLKSA